MIDTHIGYTHSQAESVNRTRPFIWPLFLQWSFIYKSNPDGSFNQSEIISNLRMVKCNHHQTQ